MHLNEQDMDCLFDTLLSSIDDKNISSNFTEMSNCSLQIFIEVAEASKL